MSPLEAAQRPVDTHNAAAAWHKAHESTELGAGIVMAEIKSEHWLTRSWRPLLMLMLMGFLLIVGLLLPLAELVAGAPLKFEAALAAAVRFGIGVGGYIGGRSLEKVAGLVFPAVTAARAGRR